jgi:hypothetical protein
MSFPKMEMCPSRELTEEILKFMVRIGLATLIQGNPVKYKWAGKDPTVEQLKQINEYTNRLVALN